MEEKDNEMIPHNPLRSFINLTSAGRIKETIKLVLKAFIALNIYAMTVGDIGFSNSFSCCKKCFALCINVFVCMCKFDIQFSLIPHAFQQRRVFPVSQRRLKGHMGFERILLAFCYPDSCLRSQSTGSMFGCNTVRGQWPIISISNCNELQLTRVEFWFELCQLILFWCIHISLNLCCIAYGMSKHNNYSES
ncbi:CLUMA_CG001006, isoform A [Clunio marinus]|uniref:CLUMA_CG001006, isoform A n=1 Tax=Clunio marinus TaxID=568069 RepID=A0A1J1HI24_9DIPT|nr:CLUMA_CG001006, isoform A [Clunio marinus]